MASRVTSTRNTLNDWLDQRPTTDTSSQYQSALNDAVNLLMGAGSGSTAGDVNAANYQNNYRLNAQTGAARAAETTKDLASGYNADYADSAAAQAEQTSLEDINNYLPTLRALALQGEAADTAGQASAANALMSAAGLAESADQLNMADWENMRDYLSGQYSQAKTERNQTLSNIWNVIKMMAQTGLNAYDTYKGYTQQQWENEFAMQQYEDKKAQQQLENDRYNTEYSDSRSDTEWQHGITEAQLALSQLASEDSHALNQAQLANYLSGGSYSGSGRSSGGSYSSGSSSSSKAKQMTDAQWDNYYTQMIEYISDGNYTAAADYADRLGLDVNSYIAAMQDNNNSTPDNNEDSRVNINLLEKRQYPGVTGLAKQQSTMNNSQALSDAQSSNQNSQLSSGMSYARSIIQQGGGTNEIVAALTKAGYPNDMIVQILNSVR